MGLLETIFTDIRPDEQINLAWRDPESGEFHRTLVDGVKDVETFAHGHIRCDVYFGPAHRRRGELVGISRVCALWVDVDEKDFPSAEKAREAFETYPAPPSFVVHSGHGFHCYWLIRPGLDAKDAQNVMKGLCQFIGADNIHNASWVLRVPETMNWKDPNSPKPVALIEERNTVFYDPRDLNTLLGISPRTRGMIFTGNILDRKSRSERDWEVVRELILSGIEDSTIMHIFRYKSVGDKYREDGDHYLTRTIERARNQFKSTDDPIIEDGVYISKTGKSTRTISTFIYEPQKILVDPEGQEDSFIGNIVSDGTVWQDVVFPKSAFHTAQRFLQYLPNMEWQWLGSDTDTKLLLLHLINKLKDMGMPTAFGTSVVGRHEDYWVTKTVTIGKEEVYDPKDAPYTFSGVAVKSRTRQVDTTPSLSYPFVSSEEYGEIVRNLCDLLPVVNETQVVVPTLGWFMATPLKPVLWDAGISFPHLDLYGTKGSGKTASILHLYMRLVGAENPAAWSPNTTSFVLRSLLSGTNAVPVYFGEFRSATVGAHNDFLRILLMSYDTGRDARGRADLSTETYPLHAPIVIDGEDIIADPTGAIRERLVVVNMNPKTIVARSVAEQAFRQLVNMPLQTFAGKYIQKTLQETTDSVKKRFIRAQSVFTEGWEGPMPPDRVRRNIAIVLFGIELFNEHVAEHGGKVVEWDNGIVKEMVNHAVNLLADGRNRGQVDDLVEDMISTMMRSDKVRFVYYYNAKENIMYFHLASVYNWWSREQQARRKAVLDLPALRSQIYERCDKHGYATEEDYVNIIAKYGSTRIPCFGIKLDRAQAVGLSVPNKLNPAVVVINGGELLT